MADVKNIEPDLDRLDAQIDVLEDTLQPMLGDLEGFTSQLPLLDKAKFFSLSAYAIETLLFCAYGLFCTSNPSLFALANLSIFLILFPC